MIIVQWGIDPTATISSRLKTSKSSGFILILLPELETFCASTNTYRLWPNQYLQNARIPYLNLQLYFFLVLEMVTCSAQFELNNRT